MKNESQTTNSTTTPKVNPAETAFDKIVRNLDSLPKGFVQVVDGEHIGRIIALNRAMTRLGQSGNTCAVVANRGDDGYFLTPLECKAYPLVNNEPTGDATIQLFEGDIIEIDGIRMRFHQGNSSAADTVL